MRNTITTTLDNILSLISTAEIYGFNDDILMHAFAEMLDNKLSDEEIEKFARGIEAIEGHGEEDYEAVKERLIIFRKLAFFK